MQIFALWVCSHKFVQFSVMLVASTEIIGEVMMTLFSILVVSGQAEINNANSHGEPTSVHLVLLPQISVIR